MAAFLDQHGLLAAFVFLLFEEAGVPVPVPGDFVMLILGVRARTGEVVLWQAILVMELATVVGASALYGAARVGGRGLVYRYGRFIRLSPERLDHAREWLDRHGSRAVFLGRLVPGLRILTAVACGVFAVPLSVYLPAMALGALLYLTVYILLGYFFGPPLLDVVQRLHLPLGLLGSLLPLGLLVVWTVRARQLLRRRTPAERLNGTADAGEHESRLRAGAVAGLLATIGSTLCINVAVNLAGNLAFQAPGTIVERTAARLAFAFARELQPALLFVAVPAFLAVGVLWGALYAAWADRHLRIEPDWARGLAFSVLPLVASLLVAMPLLGLGFLGLGATGPVALAGETVRHAAYGVLLGLIYPVLLARRGARLLPEDPTDLPAAPRAAPEFDVRSSA